MMMRRLARLLSSVRPDLSVIGATALCVGIGAQFGPWWAVMVGGSLTLVSSEVRG